jgi:hypothetical protein
MNTDIEALYQDVGREAYSVAANLSGKLLVYAEVEDGVISGSLFYEQGSDKAVKFKFLPESLQDLVYSLWEKWGVHRGNTQWRAMAFLVQDGKFSIDLTYPEQMNPDEDLPQRRPKVVERFFGAAKVDYSTP